MTNAVGPRAVFGVIVPSTNTVVEHDYWKAGVEDVAFRAGSMFIPDPTIDGDAGFEALLTQIRGSIDDAVRDVLTAEPERMVMGMSAETFWGGTEGNSAFERRIRERTGLPVTMCWPTSRAGRSSPRSWCRATPAPTTTYACATSSVRLPCRWCAGWRAAASPSPGCWPRC
ncbi:hypothetical protein [Nocardioides daphniae]|uniref:Arylmalonate decarboxylase n=1 Tax=Nocardioides daphniae TaxID=402297 RepID=A0ABQ1QC75_9ACTN|nr:hypothetical protein [Nocardioides daphniae]GGD21920.1 hypothetical protein GCM10007231_21380 [Nocardioides daphniae]